MTYIFEKSRLYCIFSKKKTVGWDSGSNLNRWDFSEFRPSCASAAQSSRWTAATRNRFSWVSSELGRKPWRRIQLRHAEIHPSSMFSKDHAAGRRPTAEAEAEAAKPCSLT